MLEILDANPGKETDRPNASDEQLKGKTAEEGMVLAYQGFSVVETVTTDAEREGSLPG